MFKKLNHESVLYNSLVLISRKIYFYKEVGLNDTFETRIFLMFFHYSIILKIYKKKKDKSKQSDFDNFFFQIENHLRESGLGDVSVNKKMKDLTKYFYDILLKLNDKNGEFLPSREILKKYFFKNNSNTEKINDLQSYFVSFYNFCFDIDTKNMINNLKDFNYGSS